MERAVTMFSSIDKGLRLARMSMAAGLLVALVAPYAAAPAAAQADPAVAYMERASRDLIAATRVRSPAPMASAINRYGATTAIALAAIGNYRAKLAPGDQPGLINGTVGFMARYVAEQAPKYPVSHVEFMPGSRQAKYGLMVDSRVHLKDGSVYDVSWLLIKAGSTYRVRDAQVLGFWATPFMQTLFENYISENGGNPKALVTVLSRYQ
jgi:phospholipid transport system substrate-binding protein